MVHFVGCFRQLGPDGPSIFKGDIRLAAERDPNYSPSRAAPYLASGHPIMDILDSRADVLDERFRIRGCSSVLSDGEWVWRWDLVHYVEKHNVRLPSEFVAHMEKNSYVVPSVAQKHLIEISNAVSQALGYRDDPG